MKITNKRLNKITESIAEDFFDLKLPVFIENRPSQGFGPYNPARYNTRYEIPLNIKIKDAFSLTIESDPKQRKYIRPEHHEISWNDKIKRAPKILVDFIIAHELTHCDQFENRDLEDLGFFAHTSIANSGTFNPGITEPWFENQLEWEAWIKGRYIANKRNKVILSLDDFDHLLGGI